MIISSPPEQIADWAGKRIGCTFKPPYSALAFMTNEGAIKAAFIFNTWTDHDIVISVAASHIPLSLLKAAFDYVVNQLGCRRATLQTRADNDQAIKALIRLGAKLEGRQRLFYGDCDALLFGILKEEFVNGKCT